MDIGWIWLALGTFFTIYSFYAWKKYSDGQWLQFGILGTVVVILLVCRLALVNLFPENIKTLLGAFLWSSWLPVFIALVVIVVRGKRKI